MKNKKNDIDFGNLMVIGIIGGVLSIILYFIYMLIEDSIEVLAILILILLVVSVILFIIGGIGVDIENKKEKEKSMDDLIENMEKFQLEYDNYADKMGVVRSDIRVTLFEFTEKRDVFPVHIPHYLWIGNDTLNLFPMSEYYKENETSAIYKPDVLTLQLKSIPIESILYFEEIGELRKYTKLSGGGSSLKGALVGYAIAGDAGAIVGSREPIKTEVISEDDRRIELIYKNQDGDIENLEFTHDAYKVLTKLIPSKNLKAVAKLNISPQNIVSDHDLHNSHTIKDKLKQLNDLKAEGLITEEKFTVQKQKILDLF